MDRSPPEIITVQSLLYASIESSLFAAFNSRDFWETVGQLVPQELWRFLRNESRDGQCELEGLEKWHFRLVIESLPVTGDA